MPEGALTRSPLHPSPKYSPRGRKRQRGEQGRKAAEALWVQLESRINELGVSPGDKERLEGSTPSGSQRSYCPLGFYLAPAALKPRRPRARFLFFTGAAVGFLRREAEAGKGKSDTGPGPRSNTTAGFAPGGGFLGGGHVWPPPTTWGSPLGDADPALTLPLTKKKQLGGHAAGKKQGFSPKSSGIY